MNWNTRRIEEEKAMEQLLSGFQHLFVRAPPENVQANMTVNDSNLESEDEDPELAAADLRRSLRKVIWHHRLYAAELEEDMDYRYTWSYNATMQTLEDMHRDHASQNVAEENYTDTQASTSREPDNLDISWGCPKCKKIISIFRAQFGRDPPSRFRVSPEHSFAPCTVNEVQVSSYKPSTANDQVQASSYTSSTANDNVQASSYTQSTANDHVQASSYTPSTANNHVQASSSSSHIWPNFDSSRSHRPFVSSLPNLSSTSSPCTFNNPILSLSPGPTLPSTSRNINFGRFSPIPNRVLMYQTLEARAKTSIDIRRRVKCLKVKKEKILKKIGIKKDDKKMKNKRDRLFRLI